MNFKINLNLSYIDINYSQAYYILALEHLKFLTQWQHVFVIFFYSEL
jgi:hypothetical protein